MTPTLSETAAIPLKKQAVSGFLWSATSSIGKQALSFASTAILARLLLPGDYGLFGMALTVTGFAGIFSDLGLTTALVQRQAASPRLLSSLFWANLVIGGFLTVGVVGGSSLAADFFQEARVGIILRVLAPTFLIASLSAIQRSLLVRTMAFDRLARVEMWAAAGGCIAAIIAAWYGLGVWSIVCQLYATLFVQTLLFWSLVRWRPLRSFAWADIEEVRRFSLNLTAFGVLNYWARNADNALIGRYLGSSSLGFYSMAYRLMQYPLTAVSGLVGRVLLPAFSKIQADNATIRRSYLKIVGFISVITFPMMFGLLVMARPFVDGLLSAKWDAVVAPLMVLSLVGANQSIATTTGNLYTAKGRTDLMLRVGLFNCTLYVVGIICGLKWGVVGVSIGYAIADFIATPIDYFFAFRLVGLRPWQIWVPISRPFIASMLMASVLYLASPVILSLFGKKIALILLLALGVCIYGLASLLFNRRQITDLIGLAHLVK